MLDKSLPYAGFFMRREPGAPTSPYPLPEGFRFAFYKSGDETCWARIETAVLEFDSEFAALMHFSEKFLPYPDELPRRCLFIEDPAGEKIATATAWWSDVGGQRRPWIQWVGADPRYQGLGVGKALISRVTELMTELEGDVVFYLHTQTWSYKAVSIYKANGFSPTNEKSLYKDKTNNIKKAMRILKRVEKQRITH